MLTLFDHITLEENKLQMLEQVIFSIGLEVAGFNKIPCSKQTVRERLVQNVDLFVSKKNGIDARNCEIYGQVPLKKNIPLSKLCSKSNVRQVLQLTRHHVHVAC